MQKAEVVFDALHSLGTQNRPLRRAYRLLFNPHMYPCPEDQGLMQLIQDLKAQRFRWGQDPVRDDWVHAALVRILTPYVGGRDRQNIHGLRPDTGIHSALKAARVIARNAQWLGSWHLHRLPALRPDRIDVLFAAQVADRRFRDLLCHFLRYRPQPEVSPRSLLTQSWLPAGLHGVCQHRILQELDVHLTALAATTGSSTRQERDANLPALRYVRYMNWLLVAGQAPEDEAARWSREISALAQGFSAPPTASCAGLQERGRTPQPVAYLGYELTRAETGQVFLRLSTRQAARMCRPFQAQGKPISRGERTPLADGAICDLYAQEFRAIAQFYALAENRGQLGRVQATLRSSMLRTLAQKHKCRVSAVAQDPGVQRRGQVLLQKVGKTRFQVKRIDDVQWHDPPQTLVGEPCAVKVACTVRREA